MKLLNLTINGTMTAKSCNDLIQEIINQVLQQGAEHLLLDLREVNLMDNTSIQYIVRCTTLAQKHGVSVAMIGLQPKVRAAYQRLAYLDSQWDFDTCDEALSKTQNNHAA